MSFVALFFATIPRFVWSQSYDELCFVLAPGWPGNGQYRYEDTPYNGKKLYHRQSTPADNCTDDIYIWWDPNYANPRWFIGYSHDQDYFAYFAYCTLQDPVQCDGAWMNGGFLTESRAVAGACPEWKCDYIDIPNAPDQLCSDFDEKIGSNVWYSNTTNRYWYYSFMWMDWICSSQFISIYACEHRWHMSTLNGSWIEHTRGTTINILFEDPHWSEAQQQWNFTQVTASVECGAYPTSAPTNEPTMKPTTAYPTATPTTATPTTANPTTSNPTTANPTTADPTGDPTADPTTQAPSTANPTMRPTTHSTRSVTSTSQTVSPPDENAISTTAKIDGANTFDFDGATTLIAAILGLAAVCLAVIILPWCYRSWRAKKENERMDAPEGAIPGAPPLPQQMGMVSVRTESYALPMQSISARTNGGGAGTNVARVPTSADLDAAVARESSMSVPNVCLAAEHDDEVIGDMVKYMATLQY